MTIPATTAGTTMRALIQENYGEAGNVLRLGQVDRPAIGDRAVLLRVPGREVAGRAGASERAAGSGLRSDDVFRGQRSVRERKGRCALRQDVIGQAS